MAKNNKVNEIDTDGHSPLSKAAHYGDMAKVVELVEAGADVNNLAAKHNALCEAAKARENSYSICEYLLAKGANPYHKEPAYTYAKSGQSFADIALGRDDLTSLLYAWQVINKAAVSHPVGAHVMMAAHASDAGKDKRISTSPRWCSFF